MINKRKKNHHPLGKHLYWEVSMIFDNKELYNTCDLHDRLYLDKQKGGIL